MRCLADPVARERSLSRRLSNTGGGGGMSGRQVVEFAGHRLDLGCDGRGELDAAGGGQVNPVAVVGDVEIVAVFEGLVMQGLERADRLAYGEIIARSYVGLQLARVIGIVA